MEILKKPYTNIHFTKAMSQIPSSAKTLKEILSNEINLDDNGMVALNEECSAIIQNKLPLKLKDPGSFSILCVIKNMSFEDVYYAILGIAWFFDFIDVQKVIYYLAYIYKDLFAISWKSIKYLIGILEDVSIRIDKLVIPTYFIVMEMEEDSQVLIILGRTFLSTSEAIIDVKNGRIIFNAWDKKIELLLSNLMNIVSPLRIPVIRLNIIHQLVKEVFLESPPMDGFKVCLTRNINKLNNNEEVDAYGKVMDGDPTRPS